MFSIAQSQCLACAGGRDMHYAGKKEFYLHLEGAGGQLCIFSFCFPFFFLVANIISLKKKKKRKSPFVSFVRFFFMVPALYKVPLWTKIVKIRFKICLILLLLCQNFTKVKCSS